MTDSLLPGDGAQQAIRYALFGDVIQVRGVGGDVTISAERPMYRVEDFPIVPAGLSYGQAQAQPGRLLLARHAVVPFTGREAELRDLLAWLDGSERVAVRLIHGQGRARRAWPTVSPLKRGKPAGRCGGRCMVRRRHMFGCRCPLRPADCWCRLITPIAGRHRI